MTSQSPTAGSTALAITLIEHAKQRSALCCRMNCRNTSPHLSYTYNGERVEWYNFTGPDQHSSFCSEDCKESPMGDDVLEGVDTCEFIDMQDNFENTALHNAVQRGKYLIIIFTLYF